MTLHSLSCHGWAECHCTVVYRVRETNACAREAGYTSMVGVSDESDIVPRDAASGAYSTRRRVIAYPRGVRP